MPKYQILIDTDVNADQEAGLQKATADYNATLSEGDLTAEQYLVRVVEIAVQSYARSFLAQETNVIAVKFEKADPVLRAAVKDALAAVDQELVEEIQP